MITHGSLFSGIGGVSLGFQRGGIRTDWAVEILPFNRLVFAKNFPNTRRYNDVREVGKHNLTAVDIISGGFPCQDISQAGQGKKNSGDGLQGNRSGLWFEMCRIIAEMRPRYALIENVSALVRRGLGTVLNNLAEIGYDAEWDCLRASDVGAPHRRERIFIVAYPNTGRRDAQIFAPPWVRSENTPRLWESFRTTERSVWLTSDCKLHGNDDGLSKELDTHRIAACGNSLMPQIAELIGHRMAENIQRERTR